MFLITPTDSFRGMTSASSLLLAVGILVILFGIPTVACAQNWAATDFDADGDSDLGDLNLLLALGPLVDGYIVEPGAPDPFDLNGDGFVDILDVTQWRAAAAKVNKLGSPYKQGDANLDGNVDGQDFILWNAGKFTSTLLWDGGDFNCDGVADGMDFIQWNENKFTSSDSVNAVPEPSAGVLLFATLTCLAIARIGRLAV